MNPGSTPGLLRNYEPEKLLGHFNLREIGSLTSSRVSIKYIIRSPYNYVTKITLFWLDKNNNYNDLFKKEKKVI